MPAAEVEDADDAGRLKCAASSRREGGEVRIGSGIEATGFGGLKSEGFAIIANREVDLTGISREGALIPEGVEGPLPEGADFTGVPVRVIGVCDLAGEGGAAPGVLFSLSSSIARSLSAMVPTCLKVSSGPMIT